MAEQQDEMSMNEILSSIKNILVEGENPAASSASGFTPPEPHSAGEEKVVPAEPVLTDSLDIEKSDLDLSELKLEDSDILELSPDMLLSPHSRILCRKQCLLPKKSIWRMNSQE